MGVQIDRIRKEIESYLKGMGYYSASIKLTSTKVKGNNIHLEGIFHEYLGSDKNFSAVYDGAVNGWTEFTINDSQEGYA